MKQKGKIKLVIFDLDGTLMDAYRAVYQSVNFALKKMGFPPRDRDFIRRSVGWGDSLLIRGFVGDQYMAQTLKIYRRHHLTSLRKGTRLLPGARRVLEYCKKNGLRLAIASNRPTRYTLIALECLNIRKYFDCIVCGDKVKKAKPHPDMFRVILKKLSLRPSEALYVGDMTIDVQAGKRAGINTVAVLTGSCSRAEIARLKPYRILKDVSKLPSLIDRLK